ncbi:uncharacterized protein I206_103888 [Kwoniella pini CBS 10737]|uniref:Uncharacterized protein n=1 Tax=Kwoniella pini CBS 10737 TaxID=1296096 RepID=A0A1B9I3F9_9TREE|nr:uncharacterized protein I206_04539 [Kwoniella pini CBS 10737]OCF50008.1 hypothetical protein I206_04539 [Kwoniella pini CBS 10737]
MLVGTLLAILPALATATVIPRASARFGRLHPHDNQNLCVAAASQTAGAAVSFVDCHKDVDSASPLELWNITTSAEFVNNWISLQSDPTLCLEGTSSAQAGGSLVLATCSTSKTGTQKIGRSREGFMSFSNANCLHKKSDSEVDIQTCWTMASDLKFYPS